MVRRFDENIRNSLIIESISELIWEYDLLTGETSIVESLKSYLGYEEFEFNSSIDFLFTLIHTEDINYLEKAFHEVSEGTKDYLNIKYRIRTKNNRYILVNSKGKVLKDKQGKGVYIAGVHLDIKEYKQCAEIEQKYKILFDNVNEILLIADINENGTSGKFIDANNMAIQTLGYSREEFLDMNSKDIHIPNKDLEGYEILCKNIIEYIKDEKQCFYTFETTLIKKDKTTLPVEIKVNVFKINEKMIKFCVIRDINERLKVEEELREVTDINKKIIDLSPLGVYLVSNGIITYANKPGLSLFGAMSNEEIVGKPRLDFVDSNFQQNAINRETKIIKGDKVEAVIEMELLKIDGSKIIGEVYSGALSSKDELLAVTYIKDITENKKIIEENKKLLQQTIEYDKLKTEFFSNISHELRTPLNIILGGIQLLDSIHKESKGDYNNFIQAFEKYTVMIRQNAYRLLKLINNILDLTKIDTGFSEIALDNHNIVEVVEDVTLSVSQYVKSRGIELIFDTDIEEKIIACNDEKIERIMLNLLSNAIKYTKAGGTIKVDIKDLDTEVMISVQDTGIGMPNDKLEVIFERFRQVDELLTRRAEGSGIGLSLVKSLVEAHGGTISVSSTQGVGSEFVILLPSRMVESTKESNKHADIIHNEDQMQREVERINIEFSDIYK